jgi:hypothetical protein
LDFSKAFDCISHELLILKLKTYGINGKLLLWFGNYLHDRKQRVVVNGSSSNFINVLSGVPQGSILGPLLFDLFINDIFNYVNGNPELYLYADDAKLGMEVNSMEDKMELQNNLNNLITWSHKWGMTFNPKKCVYMSFNRTCKINYDYVYSIGNIPLVKVSQFNDLGVIVKHNLTWDEHINSMLKKANMRLGYIKRCTGYSCNMNTKLICYKALVRPILEYASPLWHCNKNNIGKLESLQRRATKYITNDFDNDYLSRLDKCDLLPLSIRREFLDDVFLYNNINSIIDSDLLNNVKFVNDNSRNKDELMLLPRRLNLEIFRTYYTNRLVQSWNNIPFEIRSCDLTDSGSNRNFKNNLKEWLLEQYKSNFDVMNTCTWNTYCLCAQCRIV